MTKSAHPERETQNRIVTFFQKELGYKYLGNLSQDQNYNIRWGDWKKFLYDSGFSVDFVALSLALTSTGIKPLKSLTKKSISKVDFSFLK